MQPNLFAVSSFVCTFIRDAAVVGFIYLPDARLQLRPRSFPTPFISLPFGCIFQATFGLYMCMNYTLHTF